MVKLESVVMAIVHTILSDIRMRYVCSPSDIRRPDFLDDDVTKTENSKANLLISPYRYEYLHDHHHVDEHLTTYTRGILAIRLPWIVLDSRSTNSLLRDCGWCESSRLVGTRCTNDINHRFSFWPWLETGQTRSQGTIQSHLQSSSSSTNLSWVDGG